MMLGLLRLRYSNSRCSRDFSPISFCVLCFNVDLGIGLDLGGRNIEAKQNNWRSQVQ